MAGGTGGHVFPALAVANVLRARGVAVVWLGVPGSMESRLVPAQGFPIEWVRVAGIRGKGALTWVAAPLRIAKAVAQAMRVLQASEAAFGARRGRLRQRTWRHCGVADAHSAPHPRAERDRRHDQPLACTPGNTEYWRHFRAASVRGSMPAPSAIRCARILRRLQRRHSASRGAQSRTRLLIFGGSQGAQRLNAVLPQAIAKLKPEDRPQVLHQSGERGLESTRAAYLEAKVEAEVLPFIDDMAKTYAWADLAVCRAGAMTVAELQAAGLGAIFVPLPIATDDHQTKNAAVMVGVGAARIIQERDLTPDTLSAVIAELSADRAALLKMAEAARATRITDAATRLADLCMAAGAAA